MKKILIICLALVLTVAFASCANTTDPGNDKTTSPAGVTIPSDTEIDAAYAKAKEAYGWFYAEPLGPIDRTDEAEYNGKTYYKLNHETLLTYDDLEAYLKTIFTDDLTADILMQSEMYYGGEGGKLYVLEASAAANIFKGDEKREIVRESDQKIIYRVMTDVLADPDERIVVYTEKDDFEYVLTGDRWLFSSFGLPQYSTADIPLKDFIDASPEAFFAFERLDGEDKTTGLPIDGSYSEEILKNLRGLVLTPVVYDDLDAQKFQKLRARNENADVTFVFGFDGDCVYIWSSDLTGGFDVTPGGTKPFVDKLLEVLNSFS